MICLISTISAVTQSANYIVSKRTLLGEDPRSPNPNFFLEARTDLGAAEVARV